MLPWRLGWIAALLAAALLATAGAANRCRLTMTAPVPVRMVNLQPVISANINGTEAQFAIDTGSFFDFLSPAAAAQFKLPLTFAPPGYYVSGIGGSSILPQIATAKTFSVAGLATHDAQFLVGHNDFGGGVAGILGQNLFRVADVDYDFADGTLRFVEPKHCGGKILAYWATTQPIGEVDLHWTSNEQTEVIGKAAVNGRNIDVLFDSGAWRSILSLRAAKRAGITPESPGVIPAGESTGIGDKTVAVWIAPIAKFEIGGEAIEHTHVLIGDIGLQNADMLLGADFFLAHHIYIAYSQDKLYFTYNGGPVFDLNTRRPAQSKAPAGNAPPGTAAGATTSPAPSAATTAVANTPASPAAGPTPVSDAPTDAAGFMRRGMAEYARGEFAGAITDLTHACDLDPADADCHYQRGLAYLRSTQPAAALADFSAAIQRRPDDFQAYLARAGMEIVKQPAAAESDLDAVDRLAPQQADLRLGVARLYLLAGQYAGAVHQYDLWVDVHPRDVRLGYALSSRCGAEAAANVDLDRALDDCNQSLQLARRNGVPQPPVTLCNRGMVYLRQGRLDSALADFQAALKVQPKFPLAQYALGVAEIRKGLAAQGEAAVAAVRAQHPRLAQKLASAGLAP